MAAGVTPPDPVYTRDILRLAASVPDRVTLRELDELEWRSPTCGSRLRLKVEEADRRVVRVTQAVEACAFGQAAAALVAIGAPGMAREDIVGIDGRVAGWLRDGNGPAPWPGLDVLTPARAKTGRHGAILLPFRALARWASGEEA